MGSGELVGGGARLGLVRRFKLIIISTNLYFHLLHFFYIKRTCVLHIFKFSFLVLFFFFVFLTLLYNIHNISSNSGRGLVKGYGCLQFVNI